ncbi:MAG: DsbA family protein [Pyrinomonadaceae bacterium]
MAEPAVHELKKLEPEIEIIWRAFELRPEPVPSLDPHGEYLTRVWRDAVYPLAEQTGITMRLPPLQPRSRLAHEAAKWAQRENRFDDYNAALFRAFFERGEDIGDANILFRLASELALNAASLRIALDGHEFTNSVLDDEREAADLGVNGVPAFIAVVNGQARAALTGMQSAVKLREMLRRFSASV